MPCRHYGLNNLCCMELKTTLSEEFSAINAANLKRAMP